MHKRLIPMLTTAVFLWGMTGCEERSNSSSKEGKRRLKSDVEHIDAGEQEVAENLKKAVDPVHTEIETFRRSTRQDYNNRRFDELEKRAAELRASKGLFRDGSWQIGHFYDSFECRKEEPESMWQLHDKIHQEWIAAKPESITAKVAYADFLIEYGWHARGSGYSNSVSEEGWKLMGERLEASGSVLGEGRKLTEKDPVWWSAALRLALGQGWPKADYDALVAEAVAFEPRFQNYDTVRAYSLLPRWHGEKGDWETYAKLTSERKDGLGAENYARIVIHLKGYHENIFTEAAISWPKVREGLAEMRRKYPESLEHVNQTAMLATMAQDRELANEMFDLLGDSYLPVVWRKPERFAHYRNWARTGEW